MSVATTTADYELAAARLLAGQTAITPPPDAEALKGYVVILAGDDAVLISYQDGDGIWYVTHGAGSPLRWRTLFVEMCEHLVAIGHGAATVRCTRSGPIADLARRTAQMAIKADCFETTWAQALAALRRL